MIHRNPVEPRTLWLRVPFGYLRLSLRPGTLGRFLLARDWVALLRYAEHWGIGGKSRVDRNGTHPYT